jgi:hypothetical protein
MSEQLPKGITRIKAAAKLSTLDANVATAKSLHIDVGQEIEMAADWLKRTEPGKFATLADAVAAIRALV